MQSALSSVDGVESVDVNYADKTATVTLNGRADTQEMIRALEQAGYGAEITSDM